MPTEACGASCIPKQTAPPARPPRPYLRSAWPAPQPLQRPLQAHRREARPPRLLGVLAASMAAAALYLAQETQAPLSHLDGASRRSAMGNRLTCGPGGPCRAWWGWGPGERPCPSAPRRPSAQLPPLPRVWPPGSPNLAPPQSHGAGRFRAQTGCKVGVEAVGWAGSHPERGLSTMGMGKGGRAPPPLPPPPQALQLLGRSFSC